MKMKRQGGETVKGMNCYKAAAQNDLNVFLSIGVTLAK